MLVKFRNCSPSQKINPYNPINVNGNIKEQAIHKRWVAVYKTHSIYLITTFAFTFHLLKQDLKEIIEIYLKAFIGPASLRRAGLSDEWI